MTFFHLTTQHRTAVTASHEAGKRKGVLARPIGVVIVLGDNLLHIIEKLLGDERREVCLIGGRSCFYKTVVDRILKHPLNTFL
ncbi:MAG TPA: hypothetical protein DD443_01605 [Candidatus Zambryskibacteria bacterium]|nr:hypothetical protein [Candidatus Zambryskibacteria bacterium]HBO17533.1 hypothetical protein [Candidatus Zambryskibacteria bacterium]